MRSFSVMMVLALMLVLVAAQAAHYCAQEPSSSAPSPSTPSTLSPQDGDAGDCDKSCADKCHIEKCIPKHYKICIALCKLHCEHPLSYDIYHCTSACAASMSATKLGSDEDKVKGDYVDICYNNCKKNV
ncbi:uncharacterized protein LOC132188747 isoform X2 [Corylus avellana]|uniref:uncharacterized protein LOC132188747 isoform X2 n=1 Tax=Corylus avellana TaxID=13451 RepID=UPI00286BCBEB|nr:uncharacterized protein LOC132188747 isoform X2 [Corylus avellana]